MIRDDHRIKCLSECLGKKFRGAKRQAWTALEDGCNRKNHFLISVPHFDPYFSPFLAFFQKSKNMQFYFAIFSVKNVLTEKTKYTTTTREEKLRK